MNEVRLIAIIGLITCAIYAKTQATTQPSINPKSPSKAYFLDDVIKRIVPLRIPIVTTPDISDIREKTKQYVTEQSTPQPPPKTSVTPAPALTPAQPTPIQVRSKDRRHQTH